MILETVAEKVNFSAGELSPQLRARRDLARNQIGLARVENMVTLVEGVLTRCPGTQFVLPFKNEGERGRMIGFRYTDTDTYDLHFNGGGVRFFRDGGYVVDGLGAIYELAIPYLEADLPLLRSAPSGNALYLVGGVPIAGVPGAGKKPQVLRRLANDNWTIADYAASPGPVDAQNLDTAKTVKASAVTGAITLTASAAGIIVDADLGTAWRLDEPDLDLVPLWKSGETNLDGTEQRRWNGNVYRVQGGGAGQVAGPSPPVHTSGSVLSGKDKVKWIFLHKGYGYVQITAKTSPTVWSGTVLSRLPDGVLAAADTYSAGTGTYRYWPSAWSDAKGYPDKVQIHQDRLCFFRGDQFWMTKSDDFNSFEVNIAGDSAIPDRFLSPDGSLVGTEWALASGVLVVGMRDGEWMIRASNSADKITITDTKPIPDGSEGSAAHVPALIDGGAIMIGRSRRRLHFVEFDRLSERLTSQEITTSARHILKGRAAVLAFQRDPNRVLWVACENGDLRGFTFIPKEQVLAAFRRPLLNGAVEDLLCIPGNNGEATELYLSVRRTINGAVRRYIERLTAFFEPLDEDAPTTEGAWFVDCGLQFTFPGPLTVIGGLGHLEGQEVAIHADGGTRPRQLVIGGQIVLDRPATKVLVGLPLKWRAKTLSFETTTDKGTTRGLKKGANQVVVDVVESLGGNVSINGGTPEQLSQTGTADYGGELALASGPIVKPVAGPVDDECVVEIFGEDTTPFTLAGVAPAMRIAGI